MRNGILAVLVLLAWLTLSFGGLAGCTSLQSQVEDLAKRGEFSQALEKLERAGVGESVEAKAKPEALLARQTYQAAAEQQFGSRIRVHLDDGFARRALNISTNAVELCSWSDALSALHESTAALVDRIDTIAIRAERKAGGTPNRGTTRTLLLDAEGVRNFLADSPELETQLRLCEQSLIELVAEDIGAADVLSEPMLAEMTDDLELAQLDADFALALTGVADEVRAIEAGSAEWCASFRGFTDAYKKLPDADSHPVKDALVTRLRNWVSDSGVETLSETEPSFCLLDTLQTLRADVLEGIPDLDDTVDRMLLRRARQLAIDDRTAPLAWAYLHSVVGDTASAEVEELSHRIGAALQATEPRTLSIAIDVREGVDLGANELLYLGLFNAVGRYTRSGAEWRWVHPVHEQADIVLHVESGQMFSADPAQLQPVTSEYLSHYEDVINPEKVELKSKLDFFELDVSLAESNYHSAVSSHNVYPTQWSLARVSTARTSYLSSLNLYNMLVARYNAMPSMISQPVYLPYAFRAGKLKEGFAATGRVSVGAEERPISTSVVVSDEVRIGTRRDDVTARYRRDDGVDIDTSLEAQVERLVKLSDEWMVELSRALLLLGAEPRAKVSSEEKRILAWLSSPFGPRPEAVDEAEVPAWLAISGLDFAYPEQEVTLPEFVLTRAPETATAIEQQLAELVCEVSSHLPGLGGGRSRGSGTLISSDGLVLTCAHVLLGPTTRVIFVEGPLAGEYEAEVVQIDSKRDVALLHAKGIATNRWMNLSFDPVDRGLSVFAAGNPSVGPGGVARIAITEGSIITPVGEEWGQPRVVAEIAIAKGSSGGPLVRGDTGELVGVVTALAPAQFDEERAASGSFCLAAPAVLLSDWLGLTYGPMDSP